MFVRKGFGSKINDCRLATVVDFRFRRIMKEDTIIPIITITHVPSVTPIIGKLSDEDVV